MTRSMRFILSATVIVFTSLGYGCAETPVKPSSSHTETQRAVIASLPKYKNHSCARPDFGTLDSIVRVATIEAGGDASGVVIAPNIVLTAAHVLEGEESGLVYIDSEYRKAVVLGADHQNDLALLAVGTENLAPVALSRNYLFQHESVWAVGYPLAQQRTTTRGEFFRYRDGGLLTSASIDAGSSGGGLLRCENGQFKLAGMVQSYLAYYRKGVPVRYPQRSISVPAETIGAFVALHGIEL